MKVKVEPSGKNPEKHSSASKFTKFIRLLSNIYILPIEYKNDFKTVKFNIISLRTLISLLIISTPFVVTMIWLFLFQWDFTSQYFEKCLHVYHLFDFAQMFLLLNNVSQPYITFPFLLWMCNFWATFPELSQVKKEYMILVCSEKKQFWKSKCHFVYLSPSWKGQRQESGCL